MPSCFGVSLRRRPCPSLAFWRRTRLGSRSTLPPVSLLFESGSEFRARVGDVPQVKPPRLSKGIPHRLRRVAEHLLHGQSLHHLPCVQGVDGKWIAVERAHV